MTASSPSRSLARRSILRSLPCGKLVGVRSPAHCCGRMPCSSPSLTSWDCSVGPDAEPVLHGPFGAGHPYRVDPDQRHPVVPVLGEPLELRVLVGAGVDAVWAELEPSGISVPLMAVDADELYPA